MRLALQKYNPEVQYKKGSLMYIADALSRAHLMTTDGAQTECCEIRALESVNQEEYIRVEPPKRDVFRQRKAGLARKSAPLLFSHIMMSEVS